MSDGAGTNVKFATQPYQHRNMVGDWGRRCGEWPFAFSPQRISRSESGFIANVCYEDENNISDARLAVLRDASPRQSDEAKGGEAFRGLESDGKNEGCDPISTRRHTTPKREAWTARDGME